MDTSEKVRAYVAETLNVVRSIRAAYARNPAEVGPCIDGLLDQGGIPSCMKDLQEDYEILRQRAPNSGLALIRWRYEISQALLQKAAWLPCRRDHHRNHAALGVVGFA